MYGKGRDTLYSPCKIWIRNQKFGVFRIASLSLSIYRLPTFDFPLSVSSDLQQSWSVSYSYPCSQEGDHPGDSSQ
jgi:hypothetical protein